MTDSSLMNAASFQQRIKTLLAERARFAELAGQAHSDDIETVVTAQIEVMALVLKPLGLTELSEMTLAALSQEKLTARLMELVGPLNDVLTKMLNEAEHDEA